MAPKAEAKTKSDVKVVKGQDAEDLVLDYVKRMNRPYGAVDVSANLKGAVPKTAVQKILLALAEKGELVQKTYGKTSFFVANQANIEAISAERFAALEEECKTIEDENKLIGVEVKTLGSELAKLRATPTDAELDVQISELTEAIKKADAQLQPLRSGAPLISAEDLEQVDADWVKWRDEWVRRKKIFNDFWQIATDSLTTQDALTLAEDLGIEQDTNEHSAVERGPLGTAQKFLKRKR
ncbi:TBPIP-domain-containing protein [Mycena alexandri]|uniref:TBPIP-domain-containing protein n=1 Tax=Mycena alexandri TaxID=1745969 RepID=A0AAD6X772_9AGAR|nr:TBPIP-domain-containing protein [Mycena alexandri]